MKLLLAIVISFLGGILIMFFARKSAKNTAGKKLTAFNQEEQQQKQEKLSKILAYLADHAEVDNASVQALLNVSDTTAERYLDELEKQGRLVQVGKTGQGVTYRVR